MSAKPSLKASFQTILDLAIENRVNTLKAWSKEDPLSYDAISLKNKYLEAAKTEDAVYQMAWDQGFKTVEGKVVKRKKGED